MRRARNVVATLIVGVAVAACTPDGAATSDPSARMVDQSFSFPEPPDLGAREDLATPPDRDAACAQVTAEATVVSTPVDVIFVVDNSSTMADEIGGLERNINGFSCTLGGSALPCNGDGDGFAFPCGQAADGLTTGKPRRLRRPASGMKEKGAMRTGSSRYDRVAKLDDHGGNRCAQREYWKSCSVSRGRGSST
jgi:hypothetical protein